MTAVGIQRCAVGLQHPDNITLQYAVDNNHFVPYTGTGVQQKVSTNFHICGNLMIRIRIGATADSDIELVSLAEYPLTWEKE